MKNVIKISVILLIFLMAGNASLSAQRGMRGMRPDSSAMRGRMMQPGQMPAMRHRPDSMMMRRMGPGMPPARMQYWQQFRGQGWRQGPGMHRPGWGMMGPGFQQPFEGVPGPGMRVNPFPGMRILDNIPDLTDKQKKELADIRQKQQDDAQKLRTDMQQKIRTLREANRTKILSILTEEQKKWFEENSPAPVNNK